MTTTRTCPACSAPLEPTTHEGFELDRCPVGCGLWLDRGELPGVVASEASDRPDAEERSAVAAAAGDAGGAVVAEASRAQRPCPVCGIAMRLTEYAGSGIPIDECPLHGAWLDAGELERIEAFGEGMRRGPSAGASPAVRGIPIPPGVLQSLRSLAAPGQAPPPVG